jgi:hypothetical protein
MSISVGNTMLQDATKLLMLHWERCKSEWNDDKAREFEQDYIEMLKPRLRSTLAAMDRVSDQASQARRECE